MTAPADGDAPLPASHTPRMLTVGEVARAWWPLAASWLLMGLELPLVSAVLARLPEPMVSLAAYGGVVFPLSLLIEAPIIMLLAASTALSRDAASYATGRRFMWTAGLALTALHVAVAFTPLYDVVVGRLLAPPEDIREPARIGLMLMTPWTLSIAYRRFQQGVLIRFGRSGAVGAGTAVRLVTNGLVLAAGLAWGRWPGIVVGPLAVACGVIAEAVYAGVQVRPLRRGALAAGTPAGPPLTMRRFLVFYLPLMVTPIFLFLAMPLTTAAMARMPLALASLAAWPALNGLAFAFRSVGFALNEVVVALSDRPGARHALTRFTAMLAGVTSGLLVGMAVTPLGGTWFRAVAGLPPELVALAVGALLLAAPLPGLNAAASLYQGSLVHAHRTRPVTESVVALLLVTALVLAAGVAAGTIAALDVGTLALTLGTAAQVGWLWLRERPLRRAAAA